MKEREATLVLKPGATPQYRPARPVCTLQLVGHGRTRTKPEKNGYNKKEGENGYNKKS